jgi:hypothetical protein
MGYSPQGSAGASELATVDTNVDTLLARLTAARAGYMDDIPQLALDATAIRLDIENVSSSFPEGTNEFITLTAGATADTFGAWAEVVDNNAVTLSSKFAASKGFIHALTTEDYSVANVRYMLELSWGDAKTVIARTRVKSSQVGITPFVYYLDIKSAEIPAGETVYYRLKCETGGATIEASFRYHYNPI